MEDANDFIGAVEKVSDMHLAVIQMLFGDCVSIIQVLSGLTSKCHQESTRIPKQMMPVSSDDSYNGSVQGLRKPCPQLVLGGLRLQSPRCAAHLANGCSSKRSKGVD